MKNYGTSLKSQNIFRAALLVGALLLTPCSVQAADSAPALPPLDQPVPPSVSEVAPNTQVPPPSAGIAIPAPPPSTSASIPIPPPPAAISTDATQLAAQAEKAAMQAQAQAESDQARKEREHNEKSFDRAAAGILALTPDQIRDFMAKLEKTQEAAIPPASGIPKGEVRVATMPLDPGAQPPQINLSTGYVTTITIFDSTGEPWPISDVGIGGNFEVTPAAAGSHVIRIMPLTLHGTGDLSVILKSFPTPIIFRLSSGGPSVDLRYDARIPKPGPNAKVAIINHPPMLEAGSNDMMSILQNDPPKDAKRLRVSGLDSRTMAWSFGDKVYVRTPLTLLSPAWNASTSSADGMTVYEIGNAPVLLMSDNGAMVRGRLIQEDDHD